MHGRRKADYQAVLQARSEAEREAARNKVAKYKQLQGLALQKRREEKGAAAAGGPPVEEALALSAQLLRVNPDVYTLWNHRKEIMTASRVLSSLGEAQQQDAPGAGPSLLTAELALVAECIQKNPKSYGAWHHRRWLLDQAFPSASFSPSPLLAPTLDRELSLCARFLDADERNFHCWNYRRYVASRHPTRTAADEFAFSTARIYKNFSNYSAFHHRAAYLPGYLAETGLGAQEVVKQELAMVQQAVFTEPDDQTAWWYHQFLIAWAHRQQKEEEDGEGAFLAEVLAGEVDAIRGLVEEGDEEGGGGYRWAVLTLASLLRQLAAVTSGGEEKGKLEAQSRALFERLCGMDPDHAARYQSLVAASSVA